LPAEPGGHLLLSRSALTVVLAFRVPLGIAVSRRKMEELTQGVTEQHILSEVRKGKQRSVGFTVTQRKGMAEVVQFLALSGNQIDYCINYIGNIWTVLMKENASAERPIIRPRSRRFLREPDGGRPERPRHAG
jgi:glycine betaine/choline ABC-type transport system substrate-binding protein